MPIVHPAVEIVSRTERLWTDDKQKAGDRAVLIVTRLIEAGHLRGNVAHGMPLREETSG